MRVPNDRKLSNETKEIDLFLGGHDHIYYHERTLNGNLFIKSGADFKSFSLINVEFRDPTLEELKNTPQQPITDKNVVNMLKYTYQVRNEAVVSVTRFDIVKSLPQDHEIINHITDCYSALDAEMAHVNLLVTKIVCHLDDDLDTSFASVRSQETPIGNFLADLMRKEHNADCALIHGGTIRADKVYSKGFMTRGDWNEIIPFQTSVVLLEATGEQIVQALENGVSKVPALEGRFVHVSNINFSYDPKKPEGERILRESVHLGEGKIDLAKVYKVAVPNFLSWGKDGFDCLTHTPKIVDYLLAPELKDIITEFLGNLV